ncbi:MAG TPA: histidine kinase [Gemmatimonadaceae bacterium]|nr:histidine kinase [Gemmatimonadaceae bacterium]
MTMREEEGRSEVPVQLLLAEQRAGAEQRLNQLRAVVLGVLAIAALVYRPSLTSALNLANVIVLVPALVWTGAQWLLFHRRGRHPEWLTIANPVVDITAVTAIIGGYGLAQSPALALKTPIFLLYFVILAARPITSSARKAAWVAALAVGQYGGLVAMFAATGRLPLVENPLIASATAGIALLDEGAKLLLLAVAGAVSTYATQWHERLVLHHHRTAVDRRELEVRLAQAQLQTLKLQLHPHFLFNALNTVTALLHTDPDAAERILSGLSETLRFSLRHAGSHEVALARELEFLHHYVQIQQIRFQHRLTVDFRIAPDTRQALVPSLILQPLVENAIRHGIEPRACGGRVEICAERENGLLRLTVRDDGVGLRAANARAGHGIGLSNTQERLARMYGESHRFELRDGDEGGTSVSIEIPWRQDRPDGGAR